MSILEEAENAVVPVWAKPLAIILVIGGLCLAAYIKGDHHRRDVDKLIFDKMALDAANQKADALKQKGEQDEITNQVAASYSNDLADLNSALDRLRRKSSAASSSMSAVAVNPEGHSNPIQQLSNPCEGSGDDPCLVQREFFDNALKDNLSLQKVSDWVVKEHIPLK